MCADIYGDMLYLPRPISGRRRMAVGHRAKQFLPFAALRGFEEAVREMEICCEEEEESEEGESCVFSHL